MRLRLFFAAVCIAAACSVKAQSVPNAQFESWGIDVDGTDSLMGWTSNHEAYQGSVPQWLYKDNAFPHSGNFSANINSVGFGFISQPINGILVNGNAYIENALTDHYYRSGGGTPISVKPASLSGYYRYVVAQNDHATGVVVLSRYNTALGKRDTVGYGSLTLNPASNWTPFTININDIITTAMPDTILTIFWASDTANPAAYQQLFLDDFSLNIPTSIEETSVLGTSVFPNPAAGETFIRYEAPIPGEAQLELFNAQGQVVATFTKPVSQGVDHFRIDMSALSSGLYYYKLQTNGQSGCGRIIKE